MATPKSVTDGKCPYCGSKSGFTERWVQKMTQFYSFGGEAEECQSFVTRGGKAQYCASCERQIHAPDVDKLKASHSTLNINEDE